MLLLETENRAVLGPSKAPPLPQHRGKSHVGCCNMPNRPYRRFALFAYMAALLPQCPAQSLARNPIKFMAASNGPAVPGGPGVL